MTNKAYINALSECSKPEILQWLITLDEHNDQLKDACRYAMQSIMDHQEEKKYRGVIDKIMGALQGIKKGSK